MSIINLSTGFSVDFDPQLSDETLASGEVTRYLGLGLRVRCHNHNYSI